MASNLLSRLLPSNNPAARSVYDDLRAHDEASESDLEEHAGLALDEENLRFHDDELGHIDFNDGASRHTSESNAFLGRQQNQQAESRADRRGSSQKGRSKWLAQSPRLLEEEGDDDVPASLLIEDDDITGPSTPNHARGKPTRRKQPPIPGPSTRETRAHWEAAQAQQRLHRDDGTPIPPPVHFKPGVLTGSPRDKAMYRWANVRNIDNFIKDVYDYYMGAGIWCIMLDRVLSLV